jgi:hypothetical protein
MASSLLWILARRQEGRPMKKTLLEHHYDLRIEALRDDPSVNVKQFLVTVEFLAEEHGWKHLCERECIDIKMNNIHTA